MSGNCDVTQSLDNFLFSGTANSGDCRVVLNHLSELTAELGGGGGGGGGVPLAKMKMERSGYGPWSSVSLRLRRKNQHRIHQTLGMWVDLLPRRDWFAPPPPPDEHRQRL